MKIPALEVSGLSSSHNGTHLLQNISFVIQAGQTVVLHSSDNSAATVLQAINGTLRPCKGSIRLHGTEAIHLNTTQLKHLGMGSCPSHHNIFESMTVEENLILPFAANYSLGGGLSLAEIYEICPILHALRDMPGAQLAQGERTILDIARLLRTGADLILLSCLSVDVPPLVAQALSRVIKQLKVRGYSLLLAEPGLSFAGMLADYCFRLENGQISGMASSSSNGRLSSAYSSAAITKSFASSPPTGPYYPGPDSFQ